MPAKSRQRRATAYHEAGHAVAAFWNSNPIRARGLILHNDNEGLTDTHGVALARDSFVRAQSRQWRRRYAERVARSCVEYLAGPVAERIFKRQPLKSRLACRSAAEEWDLGDDIGMVHMLLGCICSPRDPAGIAAWQLRLQDRTRKLFAHPEAWAAVKEIAGVLESSGYVSGTEATRIMRKARVPVHRARSVRQRRGDACLPQGAVQREYNEPKKKQENMDISKILAELRAEREQIVGAISALESLAGGMRRRRGRPPKWLKEVTSAPKRGRPRGSKNKPR